MNKATSKIFVRQQDQADCGIACLLSIIRYYGGGSSFDELRRLSGTTKQGTTLLGLMQAAQTVGLEAVGMQAEYVSNLKEIKNPSILHVVVENNLQHYLVYWPNQTQNENPILTLTDPSQGVIQISTEELERIWVTKALLEVTPNVNFKTVAHKAREKRSWIHSLIRDDLNILLVSLFLGLIVASLSITTALFSQTLIDTILPDADVKKLIISLMLVCLLLFARIGLGYLRGLLTLKQSVDFNNRIIDWFYSKLLQLPKSFFDTRKTGDLIARMNDTRRIQSTLSAVFGNIVIDFLMVFISMIFVFVYSSVVGLTVFFSLPVFAFILYLFNKPIMRSQKEVMAGYAMAESNFVDTIQGVTDIKSFNKQSHFEERNSKIYQAFQQKIAKLGMLNIKYGLSTEMAGAFFMISLFGLTSWQVLSKDLKLGEMVALLSIAANVIPAITRLVNANIQVQEAWVAFDRMFEFTSLKKESSGEVSSATIDLLELDDISFRFAGRKQLLKNVSIRLETGKIVALVGDSGSGKSTLLQLIQKFYEPEKGKILANQANIQCLDTQSWRDQIGSVPQEIKIFNGPLLYNITLTDNEDDHKKAIDFCERKGLGKFFLNFPQGYSTLIGEEGVSISGGQKQLVALARALFRSPSILLLDEATSGMDKDKEDFIINLLQNEKREMAILLITHKDKIANRADKIYCLKGGRVFEKDSQDKI